MKKYFLTLAVSVLALGFVSPVFAQDAPTPGMHMMQHDHRGQLRAGLKKIDAAIEHLQHAGDEWGGHREAALHHLQEARHELQEALEHENSEHEHR